MHMADVLALPYELLQLVFGSIAGFEPWTYMSTREASSAMDKDLLLHARDEGLLLHTQLVSIHRTVLGLSSSDSWPALVLSRHPSHQSTCDELGTTQALRNARSEQRRRAGRARPARNQHHARVDTEDDASDGAATHIVQDRTPTATALVVHRPPPVLKLTSADLARLASQHPQKASMIHVAAALAVLLALAQHCTALREDAERVERDTPISSIEACEAGPVTMREGERRDRLRSLSGSTVGGAGPRGEALLLSCVWTVYSVSTTGECGGVRVEECVKECAEAERGGVCAEADHVDEYAECIKACVEEHVTSRIDAPAKNHFLDDHTDDHTENHINDPTEYPTKQPTKTPSSPTKDAPSTANPKRTNPSLDAGTTPKRPKLAGYARVSSGRVASLMDRFERFHL